MYCRFCGKNIAEDSQFCPYCGKALERQNMEIRLLDPDANKRNDCPRENNHGESSSALQTSVLHKRVIMFLEDGDWDKAIEYCERILDIDPENAGAYEGRLLATLKVKKLFDLEQTTEKLDEYTDYKRAVQYSAETHKQTLLGIKARIDSNRKKKYFDSIPQRLDAMKLPDDFLSLAKELETVKDKCETEAESTFIQNQHDESIYRAGVALLKADGEKAQKLLEEIENYKDSKQLIEQLTKSSYKKNIQSGPITIISWIVLLFCIITVVGIVTFLFHDGYIAYRASMGLLSAYGSFLSAIVFIFLIRGSWEIVDPRKHNLTLYNRRFFFWLSMLAMGLLIYPLINAIICHAYVRKMADYPPTLWKFISDVFIKGKYNYTYTQHNFTNTSGLGFTKKVVDITDLVAMAKTSSMVCFITGLLELITAGLIKSTINKYSLLKRVILVIAQTIVVFLWCLYGCAAFMLNLYMESFAAFPVAVNVLQVITLAIMLGTFKFPRIKEK